MARIWNRFKNYERHFLIGLVIVLLATFSISGAIRGMGRAGGAGGDYGGSLEPGPGLRVDVSDDDYLEVRNRYEPIFILDVGGPSLRWGHEMFGNPRTRQRKEMAVWAHIALVEAAKAAGYVVSDEEVREGIETLIRRMASPGRGEGIVTFSPELYDRMLGHWYRNATKAEFEKTVREIVLKDKFLTPLVESMRFSKGREQAFKDWKSSRERVDLSFVAVPATAFRPVVEKEEEARTAIARLSDAFGKVVDAKQRVRAVSFVAKELQEKDLPGKAKGVPAADAKELATTPFSGAALGTKDGLLPPDPWGHPIAYRRKDAGFVVFSAGPDGKEDTDDDVGAEVSDHLDTLVALRQVSDALVDWQKKAGKWPAALAELTTAPTSPTGEKTTAPLAPPLPKDAWGRDLAWDPAGPSLLSSGPDGARGTPDDVAAVVAVGSASVPLPARLGRYGDSAAKDAWDRPYTVGLKRGSPPAFEVSSTGADGVPGNEDDVATGNAADLQVFFAGVRRDFRLPLRREFEVVYVHLPLVPDSVLARAWKDHAEWRPDERECFDRWRSLSRGDAAMEIYYRTKDGTGADAKAIDPADPEKGHGASLLADLRKAGKIPETAKGWLVPAPECFGDRAAPPVEGAPAPASDPVWQDYVGKGWRRVLLREAFFEKLLAGTLSKARESWQKHQEWTKGGLKGPEPEVATFEKALAPLSAYEPPDEEKAAGGRFLVRWTTPSPMTREEWEKVVELTDFKSMQPSLVLRPLKDGDYSAFPTVYRDSTAKAIYHAVKVHEERDPPLEDVRKEVWPRYLDSRAMERAAKELERVRDAVAKAGTIADAAKAAAEKRGFTWFQGSTGLFVGPTSYRALPVPEGASAEEKAVIARRSYVRRHGYEVVTRQGSLQDTQPQEAGAVGQRVLKDDRPAAGTDPGTGCAYLVQVLSRQDPSPEEFGGRRYAEWLEGKAYDLAPWEPSRDRLAHRDGFMMQQFARWFDDWDGLKKTFDIRTNRAIEIFPERTR